MADGGLLRGRLHAAPRRGVISLLQLLLVGLCHITKSYAWPLPHFHEDLGLFKEKNGSRSPEDPALWIFLVTAVLLVLIGGAFAGLTIALMGQDEMYLQVIATSGEGLEKRDATKVLNLLRRGKHWVLVTLLVGNVVTNETLPIVLDRSIGGGYAAAISSTILVIIFGEIVPQSICVRFGLPIGAWMSPVVLGLMWIFSPITWPIAKLLDYLLGEDHGTTYKKAGLKTLVTLHKTMGTTPGERLNEDEVAIISGVLDLKAKPVGSIMTPMEDVFCLSLDACLDEEMMEKIMSEGYSRIPIHDPRNKDDFVGMLLVKMLITYDPEDARRVSEFALATLPETRPDTSCLDIINFFQEGKSHMVLVSENPAESYGALGVVTLEDVIEELIGEEIIDESDVFVDIHKAIRRLHPAPTHRHRLSIHRGEVVEDNNSQAIADERSLLIDGRTDGTDGQATSHIEETLLKDIKKRNSAASVDLSRSPRATTFLMRRGSGNGKASELQQVQLRQNTPEMRQHLRSLGPSNAASRPKSTRINTVKVKPGVGTIPENGSALKYMENDHDTSDVEPTGPQRISTPEPTVAQEGIVGSYVSAGKGASDGVHAFTTNYGTLDGAGLQRMGASSSQSKSRKERDTIGDDTGLVSSTGRQTFDRPEKLVVERSDSQSTVGSLHSQDSYKIHGRKRRAAARSGSITENIIESGGVKKLVLEPTSSSESTNDGKSASNSNSQSNVPSRTTSHQGQMSEVEEDGQESSSKPKKPKRRNKWRKKKGPKKDGDENTPLLNQG